MSDTLETTEKSGHLDDESDDDASEAQAQVIASLRAQVTDLFSQVTQLNSKLVSSYDRVSDLEDQLHDTSSSLRNASLTISSLELERSHHLAALNTGLLVEKAHVTAELNRLMERATEEAAQRGQAETARQDIEKDLDDLSANLFDQANTMVAEARLNQAKSERKVQDAEQALKIAEDAVKDMQVQMQVIQAEKEVAEHDAQEAKLAMCKGKWVERDDSRVGDVPKTRFMTTHTPYTEFIAFVAHLRGMRVSQPTPPAVSTLLGQPFIARLLTEDSEPTVRLDLAPSLNWLSRRSVLAAIHSGMLTVEPLPFSSLVQELYQHPTSISTSSLSCALCGTLIARLPPTTPTSRNQNTNGSSWFKYSLALGSAQNHSAGTQQQEQSEPPGQVYIFRLAAATPSTSPSSLTPVHTSSVSMSVGTSSRPLGAIPSSRVLHAQAQNSPYPLCTSNYCLTRLRSTCSLWAFVRVGVVERIWEEEVVQTPKPVVNGDTQETARDTDLPSMSEKPPIPPRRRRLWEMASALGERAVSWGKEGGENVKEKEKGTEKDNTKKLPLPPPSHPAVPHPHPHVEPRIDLQDPPPLPKRNVIRGRATTDSFVSLSGTQNGLPTPGSNNFTVGSNGHINPDKADSIESDPSTPLGEITFAAPSTEAPSPLATSHPITTEQSAPSTENHLPSPSPHTTPLPMTPTTSNPVSRVASPVPRPRSHLSPPASPSPSSRPTSPAMSCSPARSSVPAGIARTTSPSPSPGHPPAISHFRGKSSMSSLLASSRPASPIPASGPGVPPLPKRAPARRVAPLPPSLGNSNITGEVGKEEAEQSIATIPDLTGKENARKSCETQSSAERKGCEGEGEGHVPQATSASTVTAEASLLAKDATDGDANTSQGDAEGATNIKPASVTLDAPPRPGSEGDVHTSMDTTSAKQSSNTEDEGFASDATWEERTWKELVKLKEEMFLARIGGIRAP